MKKKWLQRIISMVLAVGMLMPSVGAYAEIIESPTNYKTATSMPMYANPEIQITEGENLTRTRYNRQLISNASKIKKLISVFIRSGFFFLYTKKDRAYLLYPYLEKMIGCYKV
jgi:hypothetical protein